MVPVAFATIALAPTLIHILFSDYYLPATLALQILCIYALVNSLDVSYISVIYGVDRPDISLRLGLITAGVTMASSIILIPRSFFGFVLLGGGAAGAALAVLIGGVVEYAVSRYYARAVAGVISYGRVWMHFIAGAVMAAFLYACQWAHMVSRWFALLGICLAGLALYLGILWLIREFGRQDVKFFLDLLNIRKMTTYLSSELRGKK
jgi:O-antigen/teichoic acid export membrane protein